MREVFGNTSGMGTRGVPRVLKEYHESELTECHYIFAFLTFSDVLDFVDVSHFFHVFLHYVSAFTIFSFFCFNSRLFFAFSK